MEQFDINKRFDEELERQIKGDLESNHIYELGRPCAILRSTGIPDLPIQLNAKRLLDKATLYGHDFNLGEIKGLVNKLHNPIAVFAYGNPQRAQNVILELEQNNKHFLVGLSLNPEIQGKRLEINSIRNIFPKEDTEWVNWIGQGKALYLNKKEIQILIEQLQTIPADVNYLNLDFVAKIVKNFENPKMEKEIKESWHKNGLLACRYQCNENGEKDGRYVTWNAIGQLDSRAHYKNGNLEGLYESWHSNGQLFSRAIFKEGKREGVSEHFYRTGQLEYRDEYRNGLKDGVCEAWHENGQRKWRIQYKEGKEDGLYEAWHENGQLATRTQYKEGKCEGLHEAWHKNGVLSCRVNYKNGKMEGLREDWHEDGQILFRNNYKDGLLDGLSETWHPNGKLMERSYYKEDRAHGLCETWDENGKQKERAIYKDGYLVSVSQPKKQTVSTTLKRGL